MEIVQFAIGAVFILAGLVMSVISIFGLYSLKFVLNRMHAAALNDTLALMFYLIGLMIMFGVGFASLKLLLIIIFLWFASPVSSHLISRLEVTIDDKVKDECEVIK